MLFLSAILLKIYIFDTSDCMSGSSLLHTSISNIPLPRHWVPGQYIILLNPIRAPSNIEDIIESYAVQVIPGDVRN